MNASPHNAPLMPVGFRPWCDNLTDAKWHALREKLSENAVFAAQFAREQQQNMLLHNALQEVQPPASLLQNTLMSLAQAHSEVCHAAPVQPPTQPISRRSLLQLGAMAASLLATGGIVSRLFMSRGNSAPYSCDALANLIQKHTRDIVKFSEEWNTNWNDSLLQTHPNNHLKLKPRRWCQVATELDNSTVIYDILGAENLAYLFVANTDYVVTLPTMPLAKLAMSGELSAGAWQRNSLLYVLVVHENLNLNSFLQQAAIA
jgi:hypothetical protein